MILSHELGLIFLKTRKVAGTSVEIALSAYCGDDDIITPFGGTKKWLNEDENQRERVANRQPQNYEKAQGGLRNFVKRLRGKVPERQFWEHMTASDVHNRIDREIWNRYRKVSIVRNPFDFAVSNYYWFRKTGRTDLSFGDFTFKEPNRLKINRTITHIDNENIVDTMLRYEHLTEDVKALSHDHGLGDGLSDALAGVSAKSGMRPKSETTAEEFAAFPGLQDFVAKQCTEEIQEFGYRFPS